MSAKKQTKASKKTTTKGKDIPEQVQWLLDFFNIKSMPGEYNPRKLLFAKKPNRTPTIPPENPETGYIVDHKGYVYVPSFDKDPECIGKEEFYPTSSDFKKYFECMKIRNASIVKDKDMYQKIKWLWDDLSLAFARIVTANQPIDTDRKLREGIAIDIKKEQEIAQSIIESHCRSYLDNYDTKTQLRISRGDWFPDIKGIPDTIYLKLLTWSNHKELHKRLRQCKYCGKFEIILSGKWNYCGKECRNNFNLSLWGDNAKAQKKYRDSLSADEIKFARKEINAWAVGQGCSINGAKKMLKKAEQEYGKSFKSFKDFKKKSSYYQLIVESPKNISNYKG